MQPTAMKQTGKHFFRGSGQHFGVPVHNQGCFHWVSARQTKRQRQKHIPPLKMSHPCLGTVTAEVRKHKEVNPHLGRNLSAVVPFPDEG